MSESTSATARVFAGGISYLHIDQLIMIKNGQINDHEYAQNVVFFFIFYFFIFLIFYCFFFVQFLSVSEMIRLDFITIRSVSHTEIVKPTLKTPFGRTLSLSLNH